MHTITVPWHVLVARLTAVESSWSSNLLSLRVIFSVFRHRLVIANARALCPGPKFAEVQARAQEKNVLSHACSMFLHDVSVTNDQRLHPTPQATQVVVEFGC